MSIHPHVPSDDDAASLIDLVDDCREVAGVLAPFVHHVPVLPAPREAAHVDIDASVAAGLSDWNDYGA